MRHVLLIMVLMMPAAAQKAKVVAPPAVTAPGAVTVGAAGPTTLAGGPLEWTQPASAVHKTFSTRGDFSVDICSEDHPFSTGKQRLVDTASSASTSITRRPESRVISA